jgi:hypothetical protein
MRNRRRYINNVIHQLFFRYMLFIDRVQIVTRISYWLSLIYVLNIICATLGLEMHVFKPKVAHT